MILRQRQSLGGFRKVSREDERERTSRCLDQLGASCSARQWRRKRGRRGAREIGARHKVEQAAGVRQVVLGELLAVVGVLAVA